MSTHIYLIRHGESQANRINTYIGHTDLDLTEQGHAQARTTASYLDGIHADAIYASDLLRAYHTAVPTAERKGLEIVKDKNLREIYGGAWEYRAFDELQKNDPNYALWLENIGRACPTNGESVLAVQKRMTDELRAIAERHDGQTVLVFSHAMAIRAFAAACEEKTPDGIRDIPWPSNASVSHVVYENGRFRMLEYSRDDFLGDAVTVLAHNV